MIIKLIHVLDQPSTRFEDYYVITINQYRKIDGIKTMNKMNIYYRNTCIYSS